MNTPLGMVRIRKGPPSSPEWSTSFFPLLQFIRSDNGPSSHIVGIVAYFGELRPFRLEELQWDWVNDPSCQ